MTQAPDISRPLVFLFGGQGSQYFQMGRELLREDAIFRSWMQRGDALVAARTGFSILHEVYGDHRRIGEPFDDFEVSHPALFLFQYALARTFIERGVRPGGMLGVSLGEVVACTLLDVLDFDTALTAVAEQARAIVRAAPRGGLISVMAERAVFDRSPWLQSRCEISGDFAPAHFVLACADTDVEPVQAHLRDANVLHVALPVKHPFHSRWMEPVRQLPDCYLGEATFAAPRARFVSCTDAGEVPRLAPDHFWRTLRQPIEFRRAVLGLEASGPSLFVDLTPGGTLAHLARTNFPAGSRSESLAVNSPFGRDRSRWQAVADALPPYGLRAELNT